MKIHPIISLILLGILIGPLTARAAYTIDDSTTGNNIYWGGATFGSGDTNATGPTQPSTRDYIGGSDYDIKGMNVTVTGNRMTVEIVSPFLWNGTGSNSGDLYISSTGWQVSNKQDDPSNPSSTGHDPYDIFGSFVNVNGTPTLTNTEGWDYVVGWKVTNASGLTGAVYTLNQDFTSVNQGFESIEFTHCSGSQCRNDQAYRHGYENIVGDIFILHSFS